MNGSFSEDVSKKQLNCQTSKLGKHNEGRHFDSHVTSRENPPSRHLLSKASCAHKLELKQFYQPTNRFVFRLLRFHMIRNVSVVYTTCPRDRKAQNFLMIYIRHDLNVNIFVLSVNYFVLLSIASKVWIITCMQNTSPTWQR